MKKIPTDHMLRKALRGEAGTLGKLLGHDDERFAVHHACSILRVRDAGESAARRADARAWLEDRGLQVPPDAVP